MRTIESYAEEAHELRQNLERTRKERDSYKKDAARYRWLREQNWFDGKLAVVHEPKKAVKLGHDCPSRDRLDEIIDAALEGAPMDVDYNFEGNSEEQS